MIENLNECLKQSEVRHVTFKAALQEVLRAALPTKLYLLSPQRQLGYVTACLWEC